MAKNIVNNQDDKRISSHNLANLGLLALCCMLVLTSGCGKNEAAGSVVGTGAGAIIGASVAGRNSQGAGALIGGLIGNIVGGGIGRSADSDERDEKNARRDARHRQAVAMAHEENRRLREKWCCNCSCQVNMEGARSCPRCGYELIREKFCTSCRTLFSPKTGYKFCPYCRDHTILASR